MSPTAESPAATGRPPALAVTNPSGNRSRVPIDPLPFLIGRQGENNLVLRDNRISRSHARISIDNGDYVIEDLDSRHGVFVNGQRVKRHVLKDGDRIDFGFPDSYRLAFTLKEDELNQVLGKMSAPAGSGANNLSKLRSLVEVARALQSSLSTDDVLAAVVDAALSVTGAERGFLLLGKDDQLEVSVARDRRGAPLDTSDLGVPRSLINRALRTRRDLLSMTFDPLGADGIRPGNVGGGPGAAQRGLRAADSGAHRIAAGNRGHFAQQHRGRALHGFARGGGRSFRRQSRDSADAGARSLDDSRKRAAARRRARQAAHGRRAEHRPHHPNRFAAERAAHRRLVSRHRIEHRVAPGGRRLF